MNKKIIKDESGQASMISFFIGAMIAVVIALNVAWPVMDASINGGKGYATGILTFSGNVSNGELVTITNGASTYAFEFNTTGGVTDTTVTAAINAIRVNASDKGEGWNSSIRASGNLTAAINANTSLSAILAATNTTNVTTVIYNSLGTTGNSLGTTDTVTNAAWGHSTLTGGGQSATNNMSAASKTLIDQLPLFLVLVLLMVFVRAVI